MATRESAHRSEDTIGEDAIGEDTLGNLVLCSPLENRHRCAYPKSRVNTCTPTAAQSAPTPNISNLGDTMAATAPAYAKLLAGAATQITGDWFPWGGGDGVIECFASNFNGCTVTIQALAQDAVTAIPVDAVNLVFTANKRMGFTLPPCSIRAVVTVANPTLLNVNAGALVH